MAEKTVKTAIACFVKTPGYSPIKTRFAKDVGEKTAADFYRQAIEATGSLMASLPKTKYDCFWAVTEKEALEHTMWKAFPCLHSGDGIAKNASIGLRMSVIYAQLIARYKRVILIGSDCPHIPEEYINAASENEAFSLGPSSDGGFYLLAGSTGIDESVWRDTPWSSSSTLNEFCSALNHPVDKLPELTDLDNQGAIMQILDEILWLKKQGHKLTSKQLEIEAWLQATGRSSPL